MKLKDAQEKIIRLCNIPFCEIFDESDFETIIRNKGKTGQLLELALGKKLDSFNIDFEDGELKSNKCDSNGRPLETVFITQHCERFFWYFYHFSTILIAFATAGLFVVKSV